MDIRQHYGPKLSKSDSCLESREEYARRAQRLLPHFPEEVLSQWFYDHWPQIDDYAWLEYPMLRFVKAIWSSNQVMESGIERNSSILIDKKNFEDGVVSDPIQRIAGSFETAGTWPVSPIFLANLRGDQSFPNGYRCTSPYHLIEGHHRAAIFMVFFERGALVQTHQVWVATRTQQRE